MGDETTVEKIYLTEAWVGSDAWVRAVQEDILDNRSVCFACGDFIGYRADFYYMRGRLGTLMLHEGCFVPYGKRSVPVPNSRNTGQRKQIIPSEAGLGEWMPLSVAASFMGISYTALYQRLWAGAGFSKDGFEKRDGQWFMSRAAVLAMGKGKRAQGRPPGSSKARIWRSEVTESIERISAAEAAKRIGASRSWVLARKDQFDAVKIESAWRLSTKLVEDYIRNEVEHGVGTSPG